MITLFIILNISLIVIVLVMANMIRKIYDELGALTTILYNLPEVVQMLQKK
jgi:hypothetical protein